METIIFIDGERCELGFSIRSSIFASDQIENDQGYLQLWCLLFHFYTFHYSLYPTSNVGLSKVPDLLLLLRRPPR
jgi:hypothetical protein